MMTDDSNDDGSGSGDETRNGKGWRSPNKSTEKRITDTLTNDGKEDGVKEVINTVYLFSG